MNTANFAQVRYILMGQDVLSSEGFYQQQAGLVLSA